MKRKKYYVKIKYVDRWLCKKPNGEFGFDVFMTRFTQKELDTLPDDIKGAIECGFVIKFENLNS